MRRILFGLVVLLAIVPGTSRATTLLASDVLSRARVYLRDQSTSPNRQQFPDSTLLQFLSDGQREANAQNWLMQSCFSFNLALGTTEYALPLDYMGSQRVWFLNPSNSTGYIKLLQTSMDQLDAQSGGWTQASGIPTSYYFDRTNTSVGIYPAPSVPGSTGTVSMCYNQQTADVTSVTSSVFNGDPLMQPYASALAYYVTYRGFMAVEEIDLAHEYLQYWVNFLSMMRQGTTKTPDFNPGFVGQHGSP